MFNFLGMKKRKKIFAGNISPDEIFLDAENIPNFDSVQFEGRMEMGIKPKVFWFLGAVFLLLGVALIFRVAYLQIVKGAEFLERSQNNHLRLVALTPERGLIFDRNGELLAWNGSSFYLVLEKQVFSDPDFKQSLEDFLKFLST